MVLSKVKVTERNWWKDFENLQLDVVVRNKELNSKELEVSTKEFMEKSFEETKSKGEMKSLEFTFALAKMLSEKGNYKVRLALYERAYTTFYGIILDDKFFMDVVRQNNYIHFEKDHYEYKKIRINRFYEDGVETIEEFYERHPETNFYLLGNVENADESIEDYLKAREKISIN